MPSDVIFVFKNKNQISKNMIFSESKTGLVYLSAINNSIEKIINSYMENYKDAFHYLIINPIHILNHENNEKLIEYKNVKFSEQFINEMCAELLIEMLILYEKRE